MVPLCGGNIDTTVLGRVIDRGLAADQRLIRFSATVSDRPGGIAVLCRDMADMGGSVKVRITTLTLARLIIQPDTNYNMDVLNRISTMSVPGCIRV